MKNFKATQLTTVVLALAGMIVSSASACSIHDHFCTYHALGTPRTSYEVDNDETRLVIYAKGLNTSHGNEETDFDNHALLPTETYTFDWIGTEQPDSTGPYINSRTSYGQTHESDVSQWDIDNETRGAHVYGSQYEVIFNKNTAKAIHSGDLNGGEKGNTPYQDGCPDYAGANCEAIIITGNVPNGTYSQVVQMFNHHDKDDPAVELELGAWTTGNGTLVNKTHLNSADFPGQIEGVIEQGTSSQYNFTTLEGSKAQTGQYDYEFYNRGFNPHAQGTTSWDHNRQLHNRGSRNIGTTIDFKNLAYTNVTENFFQTSFDTTKVGAFGNSQIDRTYNPVQSKITTETNTFIPSPFLESSTQTRAIA